MTEFRLTVHHLRITAQARTMLHLGAQAGAQLRGGLWDALRQFACTDPAAVNDPAHAQHCPMCRLVALENGESVRGRNPPRPFAIRPPLAGVADHERYYQAGDVFSFGINLFGDAADLFPYIAQALYRMGEIGVGYGRGQFMLKGIEAVNPLSGQTEALLVDRRIAAGPGLPLTVVQVAQAANALPRDQVRLRFLTPAQITYSKGKLASEPVFEKVIARLLERAQALEAHYGETATPQPVWKARYLALTNAARAVRMQHETRWVRVETGSRRTNNRNALGGLVGDVTYTGSLADFLPWLLWGQSLHVGKNAVKGAGWYEILA